MTPPSVPVGVTLVCTACNGEGWTVGYPNQTPTDDPGHYTCYNCHGKKVVGPFAMAPGEHARIVREALAGMVEEFERETIHGDCCATNYGGPKQREHDRDWWKARLAALETPDQGEQG